MTNQEVIANLRIANDPLFFYHHGLCGYLAFHLDRCDLQTTLIKIVPTWPLYTGELTLPVPHPHINPATAYVCCNKWDIKTKYGQNRRALCLWFADYLETHKGELND